MEQGMHMLIAQSLDWTVAALVVAQSNGQLKD